jgi:uncharacterized repeat protein (TIGR03803 family)
MKSKNLFYLILLTFLLTLIPAVNAQTFSVIHSFTGGVEGKWPSTGVSVRGNDLYGTTSTDCGSVYQLTPNGSNWTFSSLARLTKNCTPQATPSFGPDGHLYSTGGGGNGGTVFKLTPSSGICRTLACYWTVTDVHDFDSDNEGYGPIGDLSWDQQGNLYGTTTAYGCCGGGMVYQLTPSGNGYTENILYIFSSHDGLDGAVPEGGVIPDNKGNLFGTTIQGGAYNLGTIFELTNLPGVGWTEKVLYNFQGTGDGQYPVNGLALDSAGNLYGTTSGGCCAGGTVFELSPSGNSWVLTTLYTLEGHPEGTVVFGPDGALYGTFLGFGWDSGSVFKLTNTQNGWQYTSVHHFEGVYNYPICTVAFDAQGNLYGTTNGGGISGQGTVWMIKP